MIRPEYKGIEGSAEYVAKRLTELECDYELEIISHRTAVVVDRTSLGNDSDSVVSTVLLKATPRHRSTY